MRTLSSLLEPRFDTAWKDLSEQSLTSQVARKFMEVTENLAEAVMINSDVNEEAFVFSTPFICKRFMLFGPHLQLRKVVYHPA